MFKIKNNILVYFIVIHSNKSITAITKQMDFQKEKQSISKEMDELVVACVIEQQSCDKKKLERLAKAYAKFYVPYHLPFKHARTLDGPGDKEAVDKLVAMVNDVIEQTTRRRSNSMATMGRLAMAKFLTQPTPGQKSIMQSCKCTGPNRSPGCKMPPELCKVNMRTMSVSVPRKSKSKSKSKSKEGGKNKSQKKRVTKRLNRSSKRY